MPKAQTSSYCSRAIHHSETTLQAKISKAKIDYKSNLITNCAINNTSTIYNYIKDLTISKTVPSTITLDQTHVYNMTLTRPIFSIHIFIQFILSAQLLSLILTDFYLYPIP